MDTFQPYPALSGAVLIDNSTYFSAKVLASTGELEPLGVFNLGNFIDSLILAENVCLAPTTAWAPDESDGLLFGPTKPCSQIDLSQLPSASLTELFETALMASLEDLKSNPFLPVVGADRRDVRHILLGWLSEVGSEPARFLRIYSGKVHETDIGTEHFLAGLPSLGNENASPERRLAHYLLRTNVAFEISASIPYSPHSNRIQFVCEKLHQSRSASLALGLEMLKDTEIAVEETLSSELPSLGLRCHLPLALAVVLSGASNPSEILSRSIELRNTRAAKRYRRWMTQVVRITKVGTLAEQRTALRELKEARALLSTELSKLLSQRSGLTQLTAIADAVDLSNLNLEESRTARAKLARQVFDRAVPWLKKRKVKKRIAIFLSLAQKGSLRTLNQLLGRTFKRQLKDHELARLDRLRLDHSNQIRRVERTMGRDVEDPR